MNEPIQETSKNGWIKLCPSISQETKTGHKISFTNSTLGETKLMYLVYGKKRKKKGSISRQNKNNII